MDASEIAEINSGEIFRIFTGESVIRDINCMNTEACVEFNWSSRKGFDISGNIPVISWICLDVSI